MFQVDLRELARGAVATVGELAETDPLLAGLDVALAGPVHVRGRLQAAGEERFYWHGEIRTQVTAQCRRCLTPMLVPVRFDVGALFTRDSEAPEDPDCYPVPADATAIDVTPAIREELFLAAPQYLLCREDCRGLCPHCGQDLNAGPCGCAPATDARWQPFAALKNKLHN